MDGTKQSKTMSGLRLFFHFAAARINNPQDRPDL
jgi:hypothetical protein